MFSEAEEGEYYYNHRLKVPFFLGGGQRFGSDLLFFWMVPVWHGAWVGRVGLVIILRYIPIDENEHGYLFGFSKA